MRSEWRGLEEPLNEDQAILVVVAMLTAITVILSLASLGMHVPGLH